MSKSVKSVDGIRWLPIEDHPDKTMVLIPCANVNPSTGSHVYLYKDGLYCQKCIKLLMNSLQPLKVEFYYSSWCDEAKVLKTVNSSNVCNLCGANF